MEKIRLDIEHNKRKVLELTQKREGIFLTRSVNPATSNSGFDPTQPSLSAVASEQYNKLVESLVACDLEYLEATAAIKAIEAIRERNKEGLERQLEARIAEEFQEEPDVSSLVAQIEDSRDRLKKAKAPDQTSDKLAAVAAQKLVDELTKKYDALWKSNYDRIRQRLLDADQGPLSNTKFRELEVAVEKAKRKKIAYSEYAATMKVMDKAGNESTFEATYLEHQINKMQSREDQIERNLVQLEFEAKQDRYRVSCIAQASVPKTPANNKRLRYMGAMPPVVFLLILGGFLLREIAAGRVAARSSARDLD
jgi:hypothetical protein